MIFTPPAMLLIACLFRPRVFPQGRAIHYAEISLPAPLSGVPAQWIEDERPCYRVLSTDAWTRWDGPTGEPFALDDDPAAGSVVRFQLADPPLTGRPVLVIRAAQMLDLIRVRTEWPEWVSQDT